MFPCYRSCERLETPHLHYHYPRIMQLASGAVHGSSINMQVVALHAAGFYLGYQLARRTAGASVPLARCISLVTGMQVRMRLQTPFLGSSTHEGIAEA